MAFRDHLSWCECDGRIFLLDLDADRYFRLEPPLELAFRRHAAGTAERSDLARLERAGLLGERGREAQREPAARARGDLAFSAPALRGGLISALWAELLAAWMLRRKGLMAIRSVRARQPARRSGDEAAAAAREIASSFARSGLLLGTSGRCLVRAIACQLRCAARGIPAELVLGVRADPFQAHAWVQFEGELLVGYYEQARAYVPILTVRCRAAS